MKGELSGYSACCPALCHSPASPFLMQPPCLDWWITQGLSPASPAGWAPACLGKRVHTHPHLISWMWGGTCGGRKDGTNTAIHNINLFISYSFIILQQVVTESDKSPFLKYFLEIMRFPTAMTRFQAWWDLTVTVHCLQLVAWGLL